MKKITLFVAIAFSGFTISAQNGVLYASFNSTGKINSSNETANSICVDKDMKTLVLGHDRSSSTKNIFLTRYNSNGTLDNSFGSAGQFSFDINSDYDYGRCVKALSNGKYLICGQNSAGAYFRAFVLRVNNNGTIDNTFGNNGVLIINPNNFNCDAWAMEVAPSGSIFLAGYMTVSTVLKSAVWKVTPNGTLDNRFGQIGGIYISTNSYNERLFGIDIDMSNNRIAVAGISNNITTPEGLICLVDTNGNSINSFNGNCIKKIVYNGNPTNLYDVCLKSNEVVVNGNYISSNSNQKALLVSCLLTGALNTSFASNGYFDDASADLSGFQQILKDCKGDLYLGGFILYNGYKSSYIAKFKANGSLDNAFASSGLFISRYNLDADEIIEGIAMYGDSAIIAGGRINIGGSGNVESGIMRVKYNSCSNSSSIDDLIKNNNNSPILVLYPNPLKLNDVLNIQTDLIGRIDYAIYSSDGKLIANSSLENGETEISETSGLAAGVYHMVLQNALLTKRLRFVIE
jgi:uncharacterized delta-60 repeat protein